MGGGGLALALRGERSFTGRLLEKRRWEVGARGVVDGWRGPRACPAWGEVLDGGVMFAAVGEWLRQGKREAPTRQPHTPCPYTPLPRAAACRGGAAFMLPSPALDARKERMEM